MPHSVGVRSAAVPRTTTWRRDVAMSRVPPPPPRSPPHPRRPAASLVDSMIAARGPPGEPPALPAYLHAINTAASPVVRHDAMSWEGHEGTEDTTGREASVTAASLLILVPW